MDRDESSSPGWKARPVVVYVIIAAALYALIHAYALLSPILLSFILIVLITLAVNPLITRMRSWTGGRRRATALALAAVCTLGALLIWATVVPLQQSVAVLAEKLPEYWERLQKPLIKMEQQAVLTEEKLQEEVSAEIANDSPGGQDGGAASPTAKPVRPDPPRAVHAQSQSGTGDGSLRSSLIGLIQGVFGQMKGLAQITTDMVIVLVTVFVGVVFSLMNPRPIFGAFFSMVPQRNHDRMLAIMVRIATFVPRWAGSVLISMVTIGSLFFLLMWPIFGFIDAVLLGLIATLFSVVPFLGPILTLIPALLLALGQGGMTPWWVVLAYCAVQALEGNLVLPLVMSRGLKLHPVAVIFSMLFMIAAFGVLGVLIAAPVVAVVAILHDELYRKAFLPSVTDADLDRLARTALLEDAELGVAGPGNSTQV